jgi:hypothetical protein
MSLVRFYLFREKVIAPTVELTEAGFYIDAKPVFVVDLRDRAKIEKILVKALSTPNTVVPTPESDGEAGSLLLEKLKLAKWSSFEKQAVMYTIYRGGGFITVYATGRGPDGMWSNEASHKRIFHPTLSASLIAERIIEDMVKRPEARAEQFGLMIIPKDEQEPKKEPNQEPKRIGQSV